jgi:hypothetical protein
MPRKVHKGAGGPPLETALPALCVVSESLHRFPWPADPHQRYSFESPYLAVVNARGPWAVWLHKAANPPFIPLCLDLLGKGFWRAADDGLRAFAINVWAQAAREDDWGIVWGDPVRLVQEWGLNAATFVSRLDWMIEMGLAVYLTHAEAAAARDPWRYWDKRAWERSQRIEARGREEGGSKRGGEEQGQASSSTSQASSSTSQEQEQGAVQVADSARAHTACQVPASSAKSQEQASQEQDQASCQGQEQAKQSTANQARQAEAGKLPKSDQGSGNQPTHRAGHARSPSVCSGGEAVRIGQILSLKQIAWQNPLAVDFARHLVGAITGRPCGDDLGAASDRLLMDLGPWVYYWVEHVQNTLASGDFEAFRARCVKDILRKRRCRGVKNLGGLAHAEIVPGILRAMVR